ncbi:hypothetical protein [Streptomyces sp. NPDC057257]|uniref:hypothetical protein n=1 Tax=Streptomyces sp. NPDC057257 TaxID=3346071 RepID=UPI003633877A
MAPARPMSAAELEKATVTTADLDGYDVQRALSATAASRRTAEPSECTPVAQALGGSSGYEATARVARFVSPKSTGKGAFLTLSSHSAEDAAQVMEALKKSAEKCEAFKDVIANFDYEAVALRSGTDHGDDSVSVIAMFTTFVRPAAGGKSSAAVPEPVIAAQLKKLS